MASSQSGGDPDSVRDDVVDVDPAVLDDGQPPDLQWYDHGDPLATDPTGTPFDAFDASTWDISPTAVPWYATRQAKATTAVAAVAAATLVVSVVLLVVRGSPVDAPALIDNSTTASSPAQTAPVETVAVAPPPVVPPPPPAAPPPPAYVPVIARPTSKPEQQAPPTVQVSRNSIAPPSSNRGTVNAPHSRSSGG
jgi:hypothetical protein